MALVSMILGGVFGVVAAAVAYICGVSALAALAIWSGFGLMAAALLMLCALFPQRRAETRLETESA